MSVPEPQSWSWEEPEPEPTPGWEFVVTTTFGQARYERTYTRPALRFTTATECSCPVGEGHTCPPPF